MKKLLGHSSDGREQSLFEHVKNVESLAKEEGKKLGIEYIMSLIGLLHDMGKAGSNVQEYLRIKEWTKGKRGTVNHSTAGGRWFYKRFHDDKKSGKELVTELISYTILAHHGLFDMITIEEEDKYWLRLDKEPDNYEEACSRFEEEILKDENIKEKFLAAYQELTKGIGKKVNMLLEQSEGENRQYYYGCFQRLILSILIDSDWTDTAQFMNQSEKEKINYQAIYRSSLDNFYKYMDNLHRNTKKQMPTEKEMEMRELRDTIQKECIAFAENENGIYCLPIPTGGGKTLSGLAYALEYAKSHPETEKIIYVSHFLSVIEQNAEVIKKAIGKENEQWLLEHHSNVIISENIEEKKEMWGLNWEEPFICTTLVQFFHTLFSDKKQSIRRFHRLKNAVIIIDEVQSLPVKTIHTFNLMMNFLKEICNTTIVLCTATQPLLGAEGVKRPILYGEPMDMIDDVSGRFQKFERVELKDSRKNVGYTNEELKQFIKQLIIEKEYCSMLVILNSKYAVEQLFEGMQMEIEYDREIFYLTTNLCAEHRKNILNVIKEKLNNKEKILIISTSLIEAGVDLSVECVVRSMAGLDSIAQAAGRCNRNGEMEKGQVYIVNLTQERIDKMEELHYAIGACNMVLDSYQNQNGIESLISPKWMNAYYQQYFFERRKEMDYNLREIGEDNTMYKLLSTGVTSSKRKNRMMCQAYKTAGENYRLIKNETLDVIVPYEKGKDYIGELDEAKEIHDIFDILRKAQRYMVSLYGYKIKELLEKGVIRQCENIPGIYIANSYDEKKGITEVLTDLIF